MYILLYLLLLIWHESVSMRHALSLFFKCQQTHLSPGSFANGLLSLWLNSRVVSVDGPSAGGSSLDGLHGCGVQGLLLGHGPLLIAATLGALHLPLPLRLVHVVNPEQ